MIRTRRKGIQGRAHTEASLLLPPCSLPTHHQRSPCSWGTHSRSSSRLQSSWQPEGALLLSGFPPETRQVIPGKESSALREGPDSEGGAQGLGEVIYSHCDLWLMPLQPPAVEIKVLSTVENASWSDKFCGLQETGCDLRSLSEGQASERREGGGK